MKTNIFSVWALTAILLTGCGSEADDKLVPVSYDTGNLVTDLSSGKSEMSAGSYGFMFNTTKMKVGVTTHTLEYGGRLHSFVSDTVSYENYPPFNGMKFLISNFTGAVDADNRNKINHAAILLSSYDYPHDVNPTTFYVPKVGDAEGDESYITGTIIHPEMQSSVMPLVIGKFRIGEEYEVRTFTTDAMYYGSSMYKAKDGKIHQSDQPVYRIIIDINKGAAALLIYRWNFQDEEGGREERCVYVPDLKVELGNGSYKVYGENLVMYEPRNADLIEIETKKISRFQMTTSNDWLTEVGIDINFEDSSSIAFTGRYAKLPEVMTEL